MDIDVELFQIIKKYDIYRWIPETEEVYKKPFCQKLLKELVQKLPSDKTIALRGAGRHTDEVIQCLDVEKHRIKYLIDSNIYCKKEGYTVIAPTQVKDYDIDVVLISSFRFRMDFMRELLNMEEDFLIVDLYDYFAQNGVICTREFYLYDKVSFMHKTYLDVNNMLKMYQRGNRENKKYYLQKLIAMCVEIKDFIHVFQYMGEYISKGWDEDNRIWNFQIELSLLLEKIKEKLRKDKRKSIIINWIDNVCKEELDETKFAANRKKDSCVFENAYTNTPWTHFAQNLMFFEKLPITDKTYLENRYNDENSELLSMLKKNGYQFTYIANPGMFQKAFPEEYLVQYHEEFKREIMGERAISECSTRLQWISLKQMLSMEKPVCHLIHNLAEVHIPFIFTDIEEVSDDRIHYTQRSRFKKEGVRFLTEQIDWYSEFYGDEVYQIYLADHGDMPHVRAYEKGRTNIPFMVKGPGIRSMVENRIYSHIRFTKMIRVLVTQEWEKWDDVFMEYVLYENPDIYNEVVIKQHITKWLTGGSPIDMADFQVRGIRTNEDLYVIYASGKELYFRLPDESTNYIHEDKWSSRITYLRELCTAEFIDIYKEPLFKESHLLYDFLKMVPEKNICW